MGAARARIRWRQLAVIILVVCLITPVFNVLTSEAPLRAAVQGVVDGVLVSLLVAGYLMFVRDDWLRPWFRRLGFWTDLALSSAVVLTLFLVGRAAGQVVTSLDARRFAMSFTDAHLVYALPFFVVLAVTIQFVRQMNRMVGANVLGYFATGVYHRPKAEERVFLFLDLVGSTRLAERLGSAGYFRRRHLEHGRAPGGVREDSTSRPGRLRRTARSARAAAGCGGQAMWRPRDPRQGGPCGRLRRATQTPCRVAPNRLLTEAAATPPGRAPSSRAASGADRSSRGRTDSRRSVASAR